MEACRSGATIVEAVRRRRLRWGCTHRPALYILVIGWKIVGDGASKGKAMADIVPQRKRWVEKARQAGLVVVCDPAACVCLIVVLGEGAFRLFGHSWIHSSLAWLAAFLCWVLFFVLIMRRALTLDIKALDDPNDNPHASRLIADGRKAGSFDAQTALLWLCALFASIAWRHEGGTIVGYIAASIFVISLLLLMRRAWQLRNPA